MSPCSFALVYFLFSEGKVNAVVFGTGTGGTLAGTQCRPNTVELQWLELLSDHENMFETGVVRVNECSS